ncbi:hypothetical protein N9X90_04750 [Alphaproteobacteria bacterium]|nr:hypothetical protein [Alphaproteobacteria bacterium]
MAIAGSGAITMDQFHVEAGGTSGDECSLNDSDIRGLIDKSDGATMAMNEWYGASAAFYSFEITKSLRFNSGDEPHLTRTPGSAGNRKTMTFSAWVKPGNVKNGRLFGAGTDNYIAFDYDGNKIELNLRNGGSSSNVFLITKRKLRDTNAWYNIVVAIDTTQGTDTNRVKIYINGVQETDFGTTGYPTQNNDLNSFNNTVAQYVGRYADNAAASFFDGYLADVNFIDGLALAPTSFGEFKNDIWIPKDTSGLTFGTQGFRCEMKATGTSANSSGMGADTSGNTNHLNTANHVASDVVTDSPTNNWCVVNNLANDPSYALTFSEGNLKTTQTNKYNSGTASFVITKEMGGKWYMEVSSITDGNFPKVCVTQADGGTDIPSYTNDTGQQGKQYSYHGYDGARRSPPGSGVGSLQDNNTYRTDSGWGATFNQDVLSIALDWDNKKVWFAKNGTYQGSGNPAGDSNPAFSSMEFDDVVFQVEDGAGADNRDSTFIFNFGQDGTFAGTQTAGNNADDNGLGNFLYDVPAGFLALCSKNMPAMHASVDPEQGGSPQDFFNTVLYTGNASIRNVTGVGFQPDFTWIKQRSSPARRNHLNDAVRGAGKSMFSNTYNSDEESSSSYLTAFISDGFTLGNSSETGGNNLNYASWNWKANGSGSSNTNGTINTTATSVAAHGGFSISTYTGTGSNATVGHGLSSAPSFVIIKARAFDENWIVGTHDHLAFTGRTLLDEEQAYADADAQFRDTEPSSTVVTIGTHNSVNKSSETYVMYCFADIDGMQKSGIYTGTGDTVGPFIYTGFRPAMVIFKVVNTSGGWNLMDNKREGDSGNPLTQVLGPNFTDAEYTHVNYGTDYLSNGFKIYNNTNSWNGSGHTHIYIAFADQPFKYANAR